VLIYLSYSIICCYNCCVPVSELNPNLADCRESARVLIAKTDSLFLKLHSLKEMFFQWKLFLNIQQNGLLSSESVVSSKETLILLIYLVPGSLKPLIFYIFCKKIFHHLRKKNSTKFIDIFWQLISFLDKTETQQNVQKHNLIPVSYKNIFSAYEPIRAGTSGKKLHSIKIPVLLITYSKSECHIGLNNFINIICKT
ncbi:hypothetical protein AGLY_008290, partial [Aphis glycines]